jgi:hypothetical protein
LWPVSEPRRLPVLFELAPDGVIAVEDHPFQLAFVEMDR